MKNILIIFFFALPFIASAQTQPPNGTFTGLLYEYKKALRVDSVFLLPRNDTTEIRASLLAPGAMIYRLADKTFYGFNGSYWDKFASGTQLALDSAYMRNDTMRFPLTTGGEIAVKITGLPQANIIGLPDSLAGKEPLGTSLYRGLINGSSTSASYKTNGSVVFVGASLEEGSAATDITYSWPNILARDFQAATGTSKSDIAVASFAFPSFYGLTITGTNSLQSTGPTGKAIQLSPGAVISFTGSYDFVDMFYKQAPGAGYIDIYKDGTLYRSINCAGTSANICTYDGVTQTPGTASGLYEIKCRGANVTITVLYRLLSQSIGNSLFFQRSAAGGYSTQTFLPFLADLKYVVGPVVTGIHTFYINLGTNNIYSSGSHTSSNKFRSDLIQIFSTLRDTLHNVVYIFPPRASSTTLYPAVEEPYENYLLKARQVCDSMSIQMIDFSLFSFEKLGYYSPDGLHPNDAGYSFMADFIEQNVTYPQPFQSPSFETLQSITNRDSTTSHIVTVGGNAVGSMKLNPGTSSGTGWLGFYNAANQGVGYIGLGNNTMNYVAVNSIGSAHYFSGGNVGINIPLPTSRFAVQGSISFTPLIVTSSLTLDSSNQTIAANNSSNITITLPSATNCFGRVYNIKKVGNNAATVTITPNGAQTIEGNSSLVLTQYNSSVELMSNGLVWYARSSHASFSNSTTFESATAPPLQNVMRNGNTTDRLLQITGLNMLPTTGAGLELYSNGSEGTIDAKDRATNTALPLNIHPSAGVTALNVNGGFVGVRIGAPTAQVDVNGATGYNQFRLRTSYTPTSSADVNGNTGDVSWDANYFYIKTASGWKRSALSTF